MCLRCLSFLESLPFVLEVILGVRLGALLLEDAHAAPRSPNSKQSTRSQLQAGISIR